jgi:7-cyano-7-deazaguanine synthase
MNKALVLLSGGQDSTTCLFWAKREFESVEAIGFDYGQRHKLELELAAKNTAKALVPFYVAKISMLSDISPNALTSASIEVNENVTDETVPNTLVEGRNLLFLTYAGIYAKARDIHNLVIGVSQTDYSNYPDCRDEFIQSATKSLSLALDYDIKIHTPLMWISKAETWEMADELGVLDVIANNTLTCYKGIVADGCGVCPACKLRKNGWHDYQNKQNDLKENKKFKE